MGRRTPPRRLLAARLGTLATATVALGLMAAGAAQWARSAALGAPSDAVAARTQPAGGPAVQFRVDSATGHRPISQLIYGLNADVSGGGQAVRQALAVARPTLLRLGGNRWTAYNWVNNCSNAGSDYRYENDDYLSSSTAPAAAVLPTMRAAQAIGATTLLTVPIAGLVAGDCAGPVPLQNPPDMSRFARDGPDDPGPLAAAPSRSGGAVYQDQFVWFVHHALPSEPLMVDLDNEPDLWSSTHQEIHPEPASYAELLAKDLAYARAVKQALPAAQVGGPVSYGWEGYETLQNAPDSAKDGNFLEWWMRQVRAADAEAHERLIDDLDLHWYPEALGGGVRITSPEATPALVAAREQAPRSLWDAGYVEDSWITADSLGGKPIELIPRLQGEIAADDPGLGLDISEWNYGGGGTVSGAIATADVLGIFGRYGVHAAALWPLNSDEQFSYGAMAIYRNYDGHGASFGDTEVSATTTDPDGTSIYASIERDDPGRIVIVVINKRTTALPSRLRLLGTNRLAPARLYVLTAGSPLPRPAGVLDATGDGYRWALPPQSVSVLAIEQSR